MNETMPLIAVSLSAVTLIIMAAEKLFGGGNRLAAMFAKLDKDTGIEIDRLRAEVMSRVDTYEENYRLGIDAIRSNIHAMQIGLLEFRAKMAEEYMHKGDYGTAVTEIKTDMRAGFKRIEQRLDRIERPGAPHQPEH